MPTYYALGLSATLAVVDLKPSLSEVFDLKQGHHQKQDALRIRDVFTSGFSLPESPIGADGTERGVQQFIGDNEDLTFYMAEAGESLRKHGHQYQTDSASLPNPNRSRSSSNISDSSTSCESQTTAMQCDSPLSDISPKDSVIDGEAQNQSPSSFKETAVALDDNTDRQALCLIIDVPAAAFLPQEGRSRPCSKDLLVEIWLNGELASVTYVNKRIVGLESKDSCKVLFGGTRIHRQIEKPWIYDAEPAFGENKRSAEKRWTAIGKLLGQESEQRGHNKWGDRSPASEFLAALAKVQIPNRLRDKSNLGIIDVVITAGKGRKYGPGAGYLIQPTLMDNSEYCRKAAQETGFSEDESSQDESSDDLETLQQEAEQSNQSTSFPACLPSSSPEIPLMQQRSTSLAFPDSPTPKTKNNPPPSSNIVSKYRSLLVGVETARGHYRRPLGKRLGDMRQMSEIKRAAAFESLRKELDDDAFCAARDIYDSGASRSGHSPPKQENLNSEIQAGTRSFSTNDTPSQTGHATEPKIVMHPKTPMVVPSGADPEAVLTQKRIDMALDTGAPSNSALLRHISGTAPQRTPKRDTKASALANSPSSQTVKPQRHMIKQTPIHNPEQSGVAQSFTDTSVTSVQTQSRPSRRYNENEITPAEALNAFKTPDLCEGSVLTYAGQGIQRQIGKARNGEFVEETLVVGMRFVVV